MVHRVQGFRRQIVSFELLEAFKADAAAEFGWAFNCEGLVFSEYDVFGDVHYWVVFDCAFWAEGFRHFHLYLFRSVIDEYACVRFAFAHFR